MVLGLFTELKADAKEVLINPRVKAIPYPHAATVIIQALIIGVSLGFTYLYAAVTTETICQAKPLGSTNSNPEFECSGLALRREVEASLQLVDSSAGFTLLFSSEVDLQLGLSDSEFLADLNKLEVDDDLISNFKQKLLESQGYTLPNGTFLPPVPASSPEQFASWLFGDAEVQQHFNIAFLPSGTLQEPTTWLLSATNINIDENLVGSPFVGMDSGFDFYVLWRTSDASVTCTMQLEYRDPTSLLNPIFTCLSTNEDSNGPIFRLSWTSDGIAGLENIILEWALFMQNIHSPILADSSSQEVLESIFSTTSFLCCFPSRLDMIEYFGIISGVGFLLEGVITFLLLFAVCRGRIKAPKTAVAKKHDSFAYSFSVAKGVEELVVILNGEAGDIQEAKKSKVNVWSLIGVLFNPRCRSMPFASEVSFLTVAVLIGVSAVLAGWYKEVQTRTICSPTLAVDTFGLECSSLSLNNMQYIPITVDSSPMAFPFSMTLEVDNQELHRFQLSSLFNESLVQVFDDTCRDVNLTECILEVTAAFQATGWASAISGVILDPVETFVGLEVAHFESIEGKQTSRSIRIEAVQRNVSAVVTRELTVVVESEVGQDILQSDSSVKPPIAYKGFFVAHFTGTDKHLDLITDGSELVLNAIESLFSVNGTESLVQEPFQRSFVQCCQETSLEYYDYLGLMIGYVVLFEGLLTFLIAIGCYSVVSVGIAAKRRYRGPLADEEHKKDPTVVEAWDLDTASDSSSTI